MYQACDPPLPAQETWWRIEGTVGVPPICDCRSPTGVTAHWLIQNPPHRSLFVHYAFSRLVSGVLLLSISGTNWSLSSLWPIPPNSGAALLLVPGLSGIGGFHVVVQWVVPQTLDLPSCPKVLLVTCFGYWVAVPAAVAPWLDGLQIALVGSWSLNMLAAERLHGVVGHLFLYRNPRHNQSYWILGIWSFTAVSMFTCLPTCLFWKCPYTGISSTDVSHVRSSPSAWTLAHYTTTEGPTSEREPTVGPWHAQREHGQLELLSVGAASSRVLMQAYTNWWRLQLADQGGDQLLITGRTSHQCWHVVLQASHCTLRKGGSHTAIR